MTEITLCPDKLGQMNSLNFHEFSLIVVSMETDVILACTISENA